MSDINIECPTHGQPENSCTDCNKGLYQQIEEAGYTSYEGKLTPEILIDFLEELSTKKPYIDPTEGMSEKAAIAFHEVMKEYVKKNY